MSVLGFINNAIDSAVTTVKEIVTPQSTVKCAKNEAIDIISKEAKQNLRNEDSTEIKNKTNSIEKIYKQIEEVCIDYNMNIKDVKEAKLLENIAGCSTEDLLKKSNDEIKTYIDSLKFVLKWQSWKMPWQERNIDDIKKIAKKANNRCTYLQTGGSFLRNIFRGKANLEKRLKNAGFEEINAENVKTYFRNQIAEAVASGNKKEIKKAYQEAFKTFGEMLIDTENPEEKALLTAAITELEAGVRNLAVKLSISNCQNNKTAQQKVARGLSDNFEEYTKADALGCRTKNDENIEISQISFQHMTEFDSMQVLDNMAARRRELEEKVKAGEVLNSDEAHYYNIAQSAQYSGAIVGASINTDYSNPNDILAKIDSDTETFGIREQVYAAANNYVKANQASLSITPETFAQTVNKATNNNYSKAIENNYKTSENTSKQASTTSIKINNNKQKTNTQITNTYQTELSQADKNIIQQPEKTLESTSASKDLSTKELNPLKIKKTKTEKTNTCGEKPLTKEKAISKGVKAVKQFAKENNISTFELAIDSLSSSNLDKNTKSWALEEFKSASASLQKLNFIKIANVSNAKAAAKFMNIEDRKSLKSRSFDIKQAVERINQETQV